MGTISQDGRRAMGSGENALKENALKEDPRGAIRQAMRATVGCVFGMMVILASSANPVWAQFPGGLPPGNQQLGPLPPKPPQLPPAPPPPRAPELEVPPPPAKAEPGEGVAAPRIFVKDIRLTGNTAFTSQQLAEVKAGLF